MLKGSLSPQVTKVRVTALVGNTYHARVHLSGGKDSGAREIDIDARPSDAINLAVRFNAPMYVAKQVCMSSAFHVQRDLARHLREGSFLCKDGHTQCHWCVSWGSSQQALHRDRAVTIFDIRGRGCA